jgi:hypothetical protein
MMEIPGGKYCDPSQGDDGCPFFSNELNDFDDVKKGWFCLCGNCDIWDNGADELVQEPKNNLRARSLMEHSGFRSSRCLSVYPNGATIEIMAKEKG